MSQARINPFPGLRPFGEEEDYLFFGREEQTNDLLELLREQRFLAVVGTSGSGKSSLVRAGMLPALYGGTMAGVGSDWETVVFRPGGDPLLNLADAMIDADLYDPEDPESRLQIRATLSRSRQGLVQAVEYSDMPAGSNLLIVVDQFEELFRFRGTSDKHQEQASAFVKLLLNAARSQEQSIYVVITMRSDYLGDCAHLSGLAEAVNDGKYLIPKLTRDQRRDAIVMPAAVGGGKISESLVQQLLNDVGDDADQLPILQHALMRIWDYWENDHQDDEPVSLRHYDAAGGMDNALSNHADEVYDELPSDESRDLARLVFQAITERGGDERGIRRPTRMDRLCRIVNGTPQDVEVVLDAYRKVGRTFVMPIEGAEITEETVVDISHESLMRVWRRLTHWVEEESQNARVYTRLSETAELHERELAGVYRDPDLAIALSWRETANPTLAWGERYREGFNQAITFLEKSYETTRAEEIAKEEARERELEQAKLVATLQARAKKRLTVLMGCIAIALIVSIVMYFDSLEARDDAESSRNEAVAAAIESKRLAIAAETSEKAALVSEAEAQRQAGLAEENAEKADQQAQAAEEARRLADQQARDAELARKNARQSLYFSQLYKATHEEDEREQFNARRLFVNEWTPRPGLEDLRSWEWYYLASRPDWIKHAFVQPLLIFKPITFHPNGKEFYLLSALDVLERRDVNTGDIHSRLFLDYEVSVMVALPDGERLALGGRDGTLRIVYAESGIVEREFSLRHGLGQIVITRLETTENGDKLFVANRSGAFLVNLETNSTHQVAPFKSDANSNSSNAIRSTTGKLSRDGQLLLALSADGNLYQYDEESRLWDKKSDLTDLKNYDISYDNQWIITAGVEGTISLLSASDFSVSKEIQIDSKEDVSSMAWNPTSSHVVLSDALGRQFGITVGDELEVISLPETELLVWDYIWLPDNNGLATVCSNQEIYLSDSPFSPNTAGQIDGLDLGKAAQDRVLFTSDNKYLILSGPNGVSAYDRATGDFIKRFRSEQHDFLTLSNDESKFVVGGQNSYTSIYAVGTWELIGRIATPDVTCAEWSPDDTKLVIGRTARTAIRENALVSIYDVSNVEEISVLGEFNIPGQAAAVAWNSNADHLAIGGFNSFEATKRIFYVDLATLTVEKSAAGIVQNINDMKFVDGTQRLFAAGSGGFDSVDFSQTPPEVLSASYARGALSGIGLSEDKRRILVRGVASGDIKLYDTKTLEEVHTFSHDDGYVHAQWNRSGETITAVTQFAELSRWDARDAYEAYGNSLTAQLEADQTELSRWSDSKVAAVINNYIDNNDWKAATKTCEDFFAIEANRTRNPIQTNWWISSLNSAALDETTAQDEDPDVFANGVPANFKDKWRRVSAKLNGAVNANDWVGVQKYKSIYGLCRVYSAKSASYGVFLGADDSHRLWVNGNEVHSSRSKRPLIPDMDFVEFDLEEGWNTFLLKVNQFEGAFGWQLRVTNQEDEIIRGRMQNGDYETTNILLDSLITQNPENHSLRYLRVQTGRYSDDVTRVLADIDLLLEKHSSTELSRIKASLLERNGELDAAAKSLEAVEKSQLLDLHSLFKLAAILRKQENFERADSIYMRAVEMSGFDDAVITRAMREMDSTQLLKNSATGENHWRFTPTTPLDDSWMRPEFDDRSWKSVSNGVYKTMGGLGSFTDNLWARTEFYINELPDGPIQIGWDGGNFMPFTVYLNGIPVYARRSGMYGAEHPILGPQARSVLRKGRNVLAIRNHALSGTSRSITPNVRLSILDRPGAFGSAYASIIQTRESDSERSNGLFLLADYEFGFANIQTAIDYTQQSIEGKEISLSNYPLFLGCMQLINDQPDDSLKSFVQLLALIDGADPNVGIPNSVSRLLQSAIFMQHPEPFASQKLKSLKEVSSAQGPVQFRAELALREGRFDDVAAMLNSNGLIHSDSSPIYTKEIYLKSRVLAGDFAAAVPIIRDMYRNHRSRIYPLRRNVFTAGIFTTETVYHHALIVSHLKEITTATGLSLESLDADGLITRAYAQMAIASMRDVYGNHLSAKRELSTLLLEYKQYRAGHENSNELRRLDAALLWLLAQVSTQSRPEIALINEIAQIAIQQRDLNAQTWKPVAITNVQTQSGGDIFSIGNGMIHATGEIPDNDIYTIDVRPQHSTISSIEVTALPDLEILAGGPGRGGHGNAHVTELRVYRGRSKTSDSELDLVDYATSYTQPNLKLLGIAERDGRQWAFAGQQGQRSKLVVNLSEPITIRPDEEIVVEIHFTDPQWKQQLLSKVQIRTSDAKGPVNVPEYLFYDSIAPFDTATLAALATYQPGNYEVSEEFVRIAETEENLSLYGWILLANLEKKKENLAEAAQWYSKIEETSEQWATGEPLINRLFDEYHE